MTESRNNKSTQDKPAKIDDDTKCLQCGYALRGLFVSDACPECGLAVETTMQRMHGLTSRQFFTLGLRLFALCVLIWPFVSDFGIINTIAWIIFDDQTLTNYRPSFLLLLLPGVTALISAAVLWWVAPLIACIAAPTSFPLIANFGGPRTVLMIALCLFSLWLIAGGADTVLYTFGSMAFSEPGEQETYSTTTGSLVSGFARMIIGIFMLGWLIRNKELVQWNSSVSA